MHAAAMRGHGRRLAVTSRQFAAACLIGLSLACPATATAQKTVAKVSTTPVVKVEPIRVEEKQPPLVDETSLLDAAIAGITALGGVALGAVYTRKSEREKVTRDELAKEIDNLALLAERVTAVTNHLSKFGAGAVKTNDVAELTADIQAARDARDRVPDLAIRGSVDAFAAAAQEVVRDPTPGPVLLAQVQATAAAATVVKTRAAEAIDALRRANLPKRQSRRQRAQTAQR